MQVRVLLSFIVQQESTSVPPHDTDEVRILRGLFHVHLYGTFEKSINEAVEQYRLAINNLNIKRVDLAIEFYPVALDPWLRGLGSSSKLRKRIDLIKAATDVELCEVNSSVFAYQLQNIWAETLVDVAESIGGSDFYLRQQRDEFYLDEVVDKRNGVAHGRSDPLIVGARGRSPDLVIRYDAVLRILESFIQMLETHANSLIYIKESRRGNYSF
jgi:hypothetical protein